MFCLSIHMESFKDCKGQGLLFTIFEGLNIATFYSLFGKSLIFFLISLERIKNYFMPLSILQMLL